MQVNIFSIPIFIGNINAEKLKFKEQIFDKTWASNTPSSFAHSENTFLLEDASQDYLAKIIKNLLFDKIKCPCEFKISRIWTNKYEKNDYQEEHTHPGAQFSFIVYSNVVESKTVFISEYKPLNESYYLENIIESTFNVPCRSNQIVIFPSFLKHRVDRNDYSGETIAGNIIIQWQK